jgi:hypothetical protein
MSFSGIFRGIIVKHVMNCCMIDVVFFFSYIQQLKLDTFKILKARRPNNQAIERFVFCLFRRHQNAENNQPNIENDPDIYTGLIL